MYSPSELGIFIADWATRKSPGQVEKSECVETAMYMESRSDPWAWRIVVTQWSLSMRGCELQSFRLLSNEVPARIKDFSGPSLQHCLPPFELFQRVGWHQQQWLETIAQRDVPYTWACPPMMNDLIQGVGCHHPSSQHTQTWGRLSTQPHQSHHTSEDSSLWRFLLLKHFFLRHLSNILFKIFNGSLML